ncbi:hypothetical protein HDU96_009470 [Phlyctochytrium bullatum]|nr:hypothetical protein HDU96_009470 [Phlyctochytrium bullatum]
MTTAKTFPLAAAADALGPIPRDPSPGIDWQNLGFKYIRTRCHIVFTWRKDQGWDEGVAVQNDQQIEMDVAGLKAFRMKDGRIRLFRPTLNARRLMVSCTTASLTPPPEAVFLAAVRAAVALNLDFVPPSSTPGSSLYIRPVVLGTGPQLGLSPADEVRLVVYVNPVGGYYGGGMGSPVKALISADFDRAAPRGTGHAKLGGNYAPVFGATAAAKAKGHTVNLFLDAATGSNVEEFATSNFAALRRDAAAASEKNPEGWVYVTPRSSSILAGITNRSLAELASRAFGWKVERRLVPWTEVRAGAFEEVAACGTAVVLTPIGEIHREVAKPAATAAGVVPVEPYDWDADDEVNGTGKTEIAEVEVVDVASKTGFEGFKKLYDAYKALQAGNMEGWEAFEWMWPAEGL